MGDHEIPQVVDLRVSFTALGFQIMKQMSAATPGEFSNYVYDAMIWT
jgi:hypothetical protein